MKVVSPETASSEGSAAATSKVVTMTAIKGGKGMVTEDKKARSILDTYSYGKPIRQHVREFGALFGAICLIIAAVQCWKGRSTEVVSIFSTLGVIFPALGYKAPLGLYPIWKAWMAFAHLLGIVSTFILLSLSWTIVVLPLAFLMKAMGKAVMKMGYKEPVTSYWEVKSEASHDFKLLERQF